MQGFTIHMHNMIKGTYTFFEDGKQIAQASNIITKFGKRFLTNFIAGNVTSLGKEMAFGIDVSSEITAISSNGTYVTFTTSRDHKLIAGNKVSIKNVNPIGYNLTDASVYDVPTSTTFRVASSASGSYVSGGSVTSDVDTRLGFEFYRVPVDVYSTDIYTVDGQTTYGVVYKTTIPQDISGVISEIGIYPSVSTSKNDYDSKMVSQFDDYMGWTSDDGINAGLTTSNAKISNTLLTMTSKPGLTTASRIYYSNVYIDMSGYSSNDSLRMAYYRNDSNLASITVTFYSSTSDYMYYTFTPTSGTGYKITEDVLMSQMTVVGSIDKSNINRVSIQVNSSDNLATTVGFDGLRINDEDTFDPTYGMISRSILNSPYLTKLAGRQVDVEYKMELSF